MKKLIKEFIKQLMIQINNIRNCYYEEADNKAKYPYLVVPTLQINTLESGYICLFDVEIYNNELTSITVEEIADELILGLDRLSFKNDSIGFHLAFESQFLVKTNDQDESVRRISFSARLFV